MKITIDKDVLEAVVKYIERSEETLDYLKGALRTPQQLLDDGEMPDLYFELRTSLQRHHNQKTNVMVNRKYGTASSVEKDTVELEGPYECPFCGGHFAVDITFLDQVDELFDCMYCGERLTVED